MTVDGAEERPHGDAMRLGEAVKAIVQERVEVGMTQGGIATNAGWQPAKLSNLVNGKLALSAISLDELASLEDALTVQRGTLFRAAGLVTGEPTLEDALRRADLPPEFRRPVEGLLRAIRGAGL